MRSPIGKVYLVAGMVMLLCFVYGQAAYRHIAQHSSAIYPFSQYILFSLEVKNVPDGGGEFVVCLQSQLS